jgi:capsular polysaccharide biosynthesis protein
MMTEPRQSAKAEAGYPEGEIVLELGDLFQVVRLRLWVIVLSIVVCVGMAVGYSLQQTPLYQASIKVLVGQKQGLATAPSEAINLLDVAPTLSEAVATRPVAERVVQDLDLKMPAEYIVYGTTAEVIPDTQFITVSYTDTDPQRAQQIANAIGKAFSEQISEVSPNVGAITATVWESATLPRSPISPSPVRNGLIGFVVGGMIGLGLAFLLEYSTVGKKKRHAPS